MFHCLFHCIPIDVMALSHRMSGESTPHTLVLFLPLNSLQILSKDFLKCFQFYSSNCVVGRRSTEDVVTENCIQVATYLYETMQS